MYECKCKCKVDKTKQNRTTADIADEQPSKFMQNLLSKHKHTF